MNRCLNISKYCIIFDFDGTIADSYSHVFNAYNEICTHYKCKTIPNTMFESNKHLELKTILVNHGVTIYKLPFILWTIKDKVKSKINGIAMFDGIRELLINLDKANYIIGIVSSNSRQNIIQFLKANNILQYITFIHTSRHLFGKHNILKQVLKKYNLNKNSTIYIGDEVRDLNASILAGIKCLPVDWGYNSNKILSSKSCYSISSSTRELQQNIFELLN